MFGGEKLLKQEVKGERGEREARDCDTRLFAVWRVEKEESKGTTLRRERRVTFGLDLLCARLS